MNKSFLLISVLLMFSSISANGAIIFADDFSLDAPSIGTTSLINWNVTQGNVDVLSPGSFNCPSANCIDLDGTLSTLPAIIETKTSFTFNPGETYRLTFDIPLVNPNSSSSDDVFRVSLGTLYDETFSGYSVPLSITRTFIVGATITGTIMFENLDATPDNYGPFLKEVTLSAVPIPPAVWLFGSGLLGMIGIARRKKAA